MVRRVPSVLGPFVAVAMLAAAPFATSLTSGYLADDWFFVQQYALGRADLAGLVWPLFSSIEAAPTTFYRPLSFLTLAAQVRAGHPAPMLHGANLLLHGLTAALLFLVLRRVRSGSTTVALIGALFFAWFPRRVEAVAWLSCRPDLLAAFWSVVSVLAYETRLRTGRTSALALSLGFWWLAMCSKESALLLPLVHVALAASARVWRRDLLAFVFSIPVFLVVRRMAVGVWIGGYGTDALSIGPGTVLSIAKHVTYQIIPPLEGLDPYIRSDVGNGVVLLVMGVVASSLLYVAWRVRHERAALIGLAWMGAGVVPVMTLTASLTTTFNDRLLYLPAIGFGILLAAVLDRFPSRSVLIAAAVACLGCAFWSVSLSSRWALAGEVNMRTLAALQAALARTDASRIFLVAPDSIGGAYLLRNGTREALRVLGAAHPERLALVSTYFINPREPWRAPVTMSVEGPVICELRSSTPASQVMLGMSDAQGLVAYDAGSTSDRFGRRKVARVTALEPGLFWLAAPGRVQTPDAR